MKAIYLEPEMEIVRITAADVIVTSSCNQGSEGPDNALTGDDEIDSL